MGYRSDVACDLDAKEAEILKTAIYHCSDLKEIIDNEENDFLGRQPGEDCIIYWSYVKWYEGYSSVASFMSFLYSIDDESYRFVRIGEEPGDYEEEGCKWSDLHISRRIEW